MDRTHNPEFTAMEIYVSYKDYNWMMEFTERMLEFICLEVLGTTKVRVGDREIDFKAPFKRITMLDAIQEHTGIDISQMGGRRASRYLQEARGRGRRIHGGR